MGGGPHPPTQIPEKLKAIRARFSGEEKLMLRKVSGVVARFKCSHCFNNNNTTRTTNNNYNILYLYKAFCQQHGDQSVREREKAYLQLLYLILKEDTSGSDILKQGL